MAAAAALLMAVGSALFGLASCGGAPAPAQGVAPPPAGAFDYQLGGSYDPPDDVAVVVRDRLDDADPDRYSICYVNGFQSQPGEQEFWLGQHPDLVLRDDAGDPLLDPEWPDELILDTASRRNRDDLADVVGDWIDRCATGGFEGVEIDNLDTFSRFPGRLRQDDAVELARTLAGRAHAAGLAIGQKNSIELLSRRNETGFDFAVVEQCNEYDECDAFTAGYGDRVYAIEYDREAFERGCQGYPGLSIVLRDVELSTPGSPTYVRDSC